MERNNKIRVEINETGAITKESMVQRIDFLKR